MFVVQCKDKPGHSHVRAENRAAHLAHLNAHLDKVVLAGPILDEARQGMVGSVLVLDYADRGELDAFLTADPYAKAGLFEEVTVLPFKKVLP